MGFYKYSRVSVIRVSIVRVFHKSELVKKNQFRSKVMINTYTARERIIQGVHHVWDILYNSI